MFVGYQAVYDESYLDALDFAREARFAYVQFDLNVPRFYLDDLTPRELREIRSCARDRGIGFAFHAPGDNISLFTDYPAVREGILHHLKAIIGQAQLVQARHLTLHPGCYPTFRTVGSDTGDYLRKYGSYYGDVLYQNLAARESRDTLARVLRNASGRPDAATGRERPHLNAASPFGTRARELEVEGRP